MARVAQVPEPGRSGGPRPTRRNPSRAGIGGFFAFSRGSRRTLIRGNACGYAIFPYSKQHRGRDERPARTHKITSNASAACRRWELSRGSAGTGAKSRPDPWAVPRLALTCMVPSTRRTDDPPVLSPTRVPRNRASPQS